MCFRRLLFTFQDSSSKHIAFIVSNTRAPRRIRSPKHIKNNIQFFLLLFHVFHLPLSLPPAQTLPLVHITYFPSKRNTILYMLSLWHAISHVTHASYIRDESNICTRYTQYILFFSIFPPNPRFCVDFGVEFVCVFKCLRNIYRQSIQ